jgi:hypothetical protein
MLGVFWMDCISNAKACQVPSAEKIDVVKSFFDDLRGNAIRYHACRINEENPFVKCSAHVGYGGAGIFFSSDTVGDYEWEMELLLHADDTYLLANAKRDNVGNRNVSYPIHGGEGWKASGKFRATSTLLFGAFADGNELWDLTSDRLFEAADVSEPKADELLLKLPSSLEFCFAFEGSDPIRLTNVSVDARRCSDHQEPYHIVHQLMRDESGNLSSWHANGTVKEKEFNYVCTIISVEKWDHEPELGFSFVTLPVRENSAVRVEGSELEKFVFNGGRYEPTLARADALMKKPIGDDLKAHISETTKMKVRVLDEAGKPVPDCNVRVCIWSTPRFDPLRDFTTDDNGNVAFDRPVEVDILRIWVSKDKHVPIFTHWEKEELSTGETIPESIDITLPPGHRIGGTIVDENGKPVAGVRVLVALSILSAERTGPSMWLAEDDKQAITDEQGRWHVENAPALPKDGEDFKFQLQLNRDELGSETPWRTEKTDFEFTSELLRQQKAVCVLDSRLKKGAPGVLPGKK